MKKLKELSENTNIKGLKVRLPNNTYEHAKLGGLTSNIVYLQGPLMGDFFVSMEKAGRRIYPLMQGVNLWESIKESEILE